MAITFKNMREIRNEKGLSLIELSEMTNLSPGYIADLERGDKKNPTYTTLQKIAQALGVPIGELLEDKSA